MGRPNCPIDAPDKRPSVVIAPRLNRMRALQVHELGEPADVLQLVDIPAPTPAQRQVAIQVEAGGLNFPDVLMCRGQYQARPSLPFTPGAEVCGRIIAVGADVARSRVGERVVALTALPAGGFADVALAESDQAYAIPEHHDATVWAGLTITYQTGWVALHTRARIQPGEWVLVHAGAGGVGSAAIQVALAAGARVIATAGRPEKVQQCLALGAHAAFDNRADDWVAGVKDVTGGHGADIIYDSVGGDVYDLSTKCIAFEGRILIIGFTSGRIPQAAANHVLIKNYSVVGVHWGYYHQMKPEIPKQAHAALVDLLESGAIAPAVSRILTLDEIPDALRALSERGAHGKLVWSATA